MARQFYEEVRKEKRIKAIADLPVAEVLDFLLSRGVIAPTEEQLESVKKEETAKDRCRAKRKLLEEIFAQMIAAGEGLTIPSKEGSEFMFR